MTTTANIAQMFTSQHSALMRKQESDSAHREEEQRAQKAAEEARRVEVVKQRIPLIIQRAQSSGVYTNGSKWMITIVRQDDMESLAKCDPHSHGITPELVSFYKDVAKSMGLDMNFGNPFIEENDTQYGCDTKTFKPKQFPWRVEITLNQ